MKWKTKYNFMETTGLVDLKLAINCPGSGALVKVNEFIELPVNATAYVVCFSVYRFTGW